MTSILAARRARACLLFLAIFGAASVRAQDTAPAPDAAPREEASRGLRKNAPGAFAGFTLFSPLQSSTTYLVDMQGEVVHTWKTKYGPGNSDYLLDNGHLLRTARMDDGEVFHGGGIGGRIQEFDWDGALVWDYVIADDRHHQHHDIEPMPNGHVLAVVWERKTRDEVLARGRDAAQVLAVGLWPDAVLEIEPQGADGGKIVWEWHVWDHLIQDRDPKKPDFGPIPERAGLIDINADHRHDVPLTDAQRGEKAERDARMRQSGYAGGGDEDDGPSERREGGPGGDRPRRGGPGGGGGPGGPRGEGDWLHVNSIDYDAANDLILLSSPRLNEIWILDHSTTSAEAASHAGGKRGHGGDLLWRWGNPRNYGAGTDKDRKLFAQHDARWLASGVPGAGHVLVFNNGQGRPGDEYSSVDELVLPFEREKGFARADNAAFGPAELVWSYSSPKDFFSFFISGADRLRNGNTLICEGATGRLFEVTADARIVWEYLNPFGGDLPMRGPGGRGGGPPDGAPPDAGSRGAGSRDAGARERDTNSDAPREAQPGDDRGRGPRAGRGGRGGPGGMPRFGVFRATRIALDHPALKDRKLEVVH